MTTPFWQNQESLNEPLQAFYEKQNVLAFKNSFRNSRGYHPSTYHQSWRISNHIQCFNTKKIHDSGSQYFGPEKYSLWTENEAVRNHHFDLRSVLHQRKLILKESSHSTFAQLLPDFSGIFCKYEWDIGKCDLEQHRMTAYPCSTPVKPPNFRIPINLKSGLREKLDKFLEHELIEPCHSPYSAPALLVSKKNGKLRFVIDYRQPNKQTFKSHWLILSIEEIFDTLEGRFYFSLIDESRVVYHLSKEEASQDYTAFSIPFGSFIWLRMPLDIIGSPKSFQTLMEKLLIGLTIILVWMIASVSLEQSKNT